MNPIDQTILNDAANALSIARTNLALSCAESTPLPEKVNFHAAMVEVRVHEYQAVKTEIALRETREKMELAHALYCDSKAIPSQSTSVS